MEGSVARQRAFWGGLTVTGVVTMYVAVLVLDGCTARTEMGVCVANDYSGVGFLLGFIGIGVTLYGLSLFFHAGAPDRVVRYEFTRGVRPEVAARAERQARILILGLLAAGLLVAELVPAYSIVQQQLAEVPSPFNPVVFGIDMALMGVADAIALFFVHLHLKNG